MLLLLMSLSAKRVFASCNLKSIGDTTLSNSVCSIDSGTIEGIDSATAETSSTNTAVLTLDNSALTMNTNATLIVGSVRLLGTSSISTLASGITIKPGSAVWVNDTDADGWPSSFTLYEATASGRRRLGLMRSSNYTDCNDTSDYRIDNQCCTMTSWYQDADNDMYGNPLVHQSSCTQPPGYVSNGSDCYDSNANAKPGSLTCSTTDRGDGNFDFDCNGTQTVCGTPLTHDTIPISTAYEQANGSCNQGNARCVSGFRNLYPSAAISCGAAGATCTTTALYGGNCSCQSCPDGCSTTGKYSACSAISPGSVQACQ